MILTNILVMKINNINFLSHAYFFLLKSQQQSFFLAEESIEVTILIHLTAWRKIIIYNNAQYSRWLNVCSYFLITNTAK